MSTRFYTLQFNNVAVTAAQDLFALKVGASIPIKIHQFELNSESSTSPAELRVIIKRMTATVTMGTGGSTGLTPASIASSDTTCSITNAGTNNTSRATTSGSSTTLFAWGWNVLNGLLFVPPPEWMPTFQVNEGCIIGLETAPGGSTTMDGYVVFSELS